MALFGMQILLITNLKKLVLMKFLFKKEKVMNGLQFRSPSLKEYGDLDSELYFQHFLRFVKILSEITYLARKQLRSMDLHIFT